MRLNVLIGGKAGQGINKISQIVSEVLVSQGYFIFNYRDYQSLIRGGHNFNILSISDKRIASHESKIDGIVALDDKTLEIHKKELRKNAFIISSRNFENHEAMFGKNLNMVLAGALLKVFGIDNDHLIKIVNKDFGEKAVEAAEKGYKSQKSKFFLGKLNSKITTMSGAEAISLGAINSGINLYLGYPMTPATGVLHELGSRKSKDLIVFQPENEIAVANMALGASFAGSKVMIGSSGGGFDLMTEALSLQGQSQIPLVVYLASRPGPGTGSPTYTCQSDLDDALRSGHGEFPRIVIAPGDTIDCIEKTNEAFYLAEKFNSLAIILSDKHLAESQFSSDINPQKIIKVKIKRKIPGKAIVKASSYEHDKKGNTIEDAETIKKNAEERLRIYGRIKKETRKFEMIKIHGDKASKNLIIGWGSTKGAIIDAISGLNVKFLQVLYLKPMSDNIRKEIKGADKVVLIENNLTGQLGRLIREKTGIKIENKILRYDGRPFTSDELRNEIVKLIK